MRWMRRRCAVATACLLVVVVGGGVAPGAGAVTFKAATLTATEVEQFDWINSSVAVDGDTIVVGVPWRTVDGKTAQGALYVFTKPADGWVDATQTARLVAADGDEFDKLGTSVSVQGDTIVAGASAVDGLDAGRVYVFKRPPGGWVNGTSTAKLTASDGNIGDQLGASVALDGDTIVAGAPGWEAGSTGNTSDGAAYVFVRDGADWASATQDALLTHDPADFSSHLGTSVAIEGDTVVAGAPRADPVESDRGAGYVYVRTGAAWNDDVQPIAPSAQLRADDASERLGSAVAIAGDTIAVGEPNDDNGAENRGAVHLFVRAGTTWASRDTDARLRPSDNASVRLGSALAMEANVVLAGTMTAAPPGLAYRFDRPAAGWVDSSETVRLANQQLMGPPVGLSGDTSVTGYGATAYVFVDDPVAPDTTISEGPSGPLSDTTPTFAFTATEPHVTFACSSGGGSFEPCQSPFTPTPLDDGPYTFAVRATDRAGNVDATPATRDVTIDTEAPHSTISGAPGPLTTDSTPTLTLAANEPGATFACSVDMQGFSPCDSPFTPPALADGAHSITVRATDAAGNVEIAPPSASFTVDTVAPETTIAAGPAGRTAQASPTFGFAASEAGATFACRVDSGPLAACTSPFTLARLRPGAHVFAVHATDPAGNVDATPATRAFNVLPPVVSGTVLLANALIKRARLTALVRLRVLELTGAEAILVRCRGKGCPLKRKRVKAPKGRETLNLTRLVKGARLRAGAVITVEISRPDYVTKVWQFTARRKANLKVTRRCRAPGETRLRDCADFAVAG